MIFMAINFFYMFINYYNFDFIYFNKELSNI